MIWSSSSGRIEVKVTLAQARSASHQGQCDADVESLSRVPAIRRQLRQIDPSTLSQELGEYGAWDDTERLDHEQNLQRLLWVACGDIADGN